MSISRKFLLFLIVASAVAGGFLLGQQFNLSVVAQRKPKTAVKVLDLLKRFEQEKIRDFAVLNLDDNKFYAVIRGESPTKDSVDKTGDQLSIYDETGKIVYEHSDVAIGNLSSERLLKPDEHELVFSTNGGGTDRFINVLSYRNGKFIEILNDGTQYRGGYFTMLQYRTGNKTPYFKPSQLILIQQQGGADENPRASVFRANDDKLQKVGEIRMREFGDFIENQVNTSRQTGLQRKDAGKQSREDFLKTVFPIMNDKDVSKVLLHY